MGVSLKFQQQSQLGSQEPTCEPYHSESCQLKAFTSFCCQYSLTKLIRIPGYSASPDMLLRCFHVIVISLAVQAALGLPISILGADFINNADLRLTDPVDLSKNIVATTFPPQDILKPLKLLSFPYCMLRGDCRRS